jgi:hypothetical protein
VDNDKAEASERECRGAERIEWTGAGGGYFLAVVVDQDDEVIAERWGTRKEVLAWMETQWPELPKKYVPMALGVSQRRAERRKAHPSKRKKNAVLGVEWRAG